jgi:hypothetical protein
MAFTLWTPLRRLFTQSRELGFCCMSGTLISNPWGGLIPAWLALLASLTPAAAQPPFSPAQQPGAAARNPICVRLEAQLAAVDRGNVDPARADQIKRLDDAANRQQADLDRLTAQARRLGCEGRGLFSIFMEQPQQCGQLNNQIQQLRANLDRVLADLQRAQGGTADREGQRRTILASLGQNDCGPQYRNFANNNPSGGGNFFERLFGPATTAPNSNIPELPQVANSGSYRALCVRTCDGYYFPLSSSASSRFGEDEKTCQRLCPAAETALYTQRSQGEDVSQAVSSAGRPYAELPTAFAYRKQFNAACTCKQPGQTWADALRNMEDRTIERGDIVVDEERARLLSLPPEARPQRPTTRPATTPARATPPAPAASNPTAAPPTSLAPPADNSADTDQGQRTVRPVGPTFLPPR